MQINTVLKFINVNKIIGNRKIIENMTFEIKEGEVFGLLGPNGAGKTTIIRMIVGLISVTSGEITIGSKSISHDFEKAVGQIGAIVESPDLYKYLSGYKNLKMFARIYPNVTQDDINACVRFVGLQETIHDKVKTYSLGMRQRLGIALAMLHKPAILILDEPTNGLDPEGIHNMRNYLRKLANEYNTTIIVSSHILSEMELMCDRFAIVNNGKLINITSMTEKNIIAIPKYFFEMEDNETAKNAVVLLDKQGMETQIQGEGFLISTLRREIPNIIHTLVSNGINIYSIIPQKDSLEQYYLNVVGGLKV